MSITVPANVEFETVWGRMTGVEAGRCFGLSAGGAAIGTAQSGTPDYLSADGALAYWGWSAGAGAYYSTAPYRYGVPLTWNNNRRAHEVRKLLAQAFAEDASAFVAAATAGDDARAAALVAAEPPVAAGARALTNIYHWSANTDVTPNNYAAYLARYPDADARGNLVDYVPIWYGIHGGGAAAPPNAATVASLLAARPAGRRCIKLHSFNCFGAIPVTSGAASGRYAIMEREFDHATRIGLSLVNWQTQMLDAGSAWRAFWSDLLAAGGPSIVDYIFDSLERAPRFALLANWGGNSYPERWSDIFTDASWSSGESLRALVLPALDQTVWDTWNTWNFQEDERCFLFDAWMQAYWRAKWEPVWKIVTDSFPDVAISSYDHGSLAVGNRPTASAPSATSAPYGNGPYVSDGAARRKSSVACYGLYDSKRWRWDSLDSPTDAASGDQRAWNATLQAVSLIDSQAAASRFRHEVWLTAPALYYYGGAESLGREVILQALLDDADCNFYNTNGGLGAAPAITPEQHQLFVDLVAERDRVIGYAAARLDPPPPPQLNYAQTYIARRSWSGNRWIWRITPQPGLGATRIDRLAGETLRLTFADSRTLEIPRGRLIVPPGGTLAPGGYWVEQRPPRRPRRAGSVAVTTTAAQPCPAPAKDWSRRLTVRADAANTDIVYLGASSAVNGTAGSADCGFPLAAGEERTFPLSTFQDAADETGLWAVAASGTQYLHWEAH